MTDVERINLRRILFLPFARRRANALSRRVTGKLAAIRSRVNVHSLASEYLSGRLMHARNGFVWHRSAIGQLTASLFHFALANAAI
jgi:hypothetical protein